MVKIAPAPSYREGISFQSSEDQVLGPHSCQLQRDLRIRSGKSITGQKRQAQESFSSALF